MVDPLEGYPHLKWLPYKIRLPCPYGCHTIIPTLAYVWDPKISEGWGRTTSGFRGAWLISRNTPLPTRTVGHHAEFGCSRSNGVGEVWYVILGALGPAHVAEERGWFQKQASAARGILCRICSLSVKRCRRTYGCPQVCEH